MSRPLHKLSAAFLRSPPPGTHSDGGGLYFHKRGDGGAQWFFRYKRSGRSHWMGLGGYPDVSLKLAREKAEEARAICAKGGDPLEERRKAQAEAQASDPSVHALTMEAFEARKSSLKGDGEAGRWMSPVELHILPKLGKIHVAELTPRDIVGALKPIWNEKPDAARKALQRLGLVLKHAAALGMDVDLQATTKARALLGAPRHKSQHIEALHYSEVPPFYAQLTDLSATTLALRLLILTGGGMRSKPVRFMELDEIKGDVWIIPGRKMKGNELKAPPDFHVPLTPEAQEVIELARPLHHGGFVFGTSSKEGVISVNSMSALMKRKSTSARPHGFRNTITDWLLEVQRAPYEVRKHMLAQRVGGSVDQAYNRSDLLDERRRLLQLWADFVTSKSGEGQARS